MRTSDFSSAPRQAQAEAMVIIETSTGTKRRARTRHLRRLLAARSGFVWQYPYARAGGTRGVIVYFADAASREASIASANVVANGFTLKRLDADPQGYSNGVWRAESHEMAHIERFSATSVEDRRGTTPPAVAEAAKRDHRQPSPRKSVAKEARSAQHPARPTTDSGAMFVGATRYTGPAAWLILSRTWYPMIARMKTMRGYVWHAVYYERPFTLGTLAFFAERDDLMAFARLPAHRKLMVWITKNTHNGTGGYIRVHLAKKDS